MSRAVSSCVAYADCAGQLGRLLISKGADINVRDKANQLPLFVPAPSLLR